MKTFMKTKVWTVLLGLAVCVFVVRNEFKHHAHEAARPHWKSVPEGAGLPTVDAQLSQLSQLPSRDEISGRNIKQLIFPQQGRLGRDAFEKDILDRLGPWRLPVMCNDGQGPERRTKLRTPYPVLFDSQPDQNGLWLEFGVYNGNSIRQTAAHRDEGKLLYGFDSFEGLPTDKDTTSNQPFYKNNWFAGSFSRRGKLPVVPKSVILIKGWFDRTLPEFLLKQKNEVVTYLHIDSDLYSSARTILKLLSDDGRLRPGTLIIFDELIGTDVLKEAELRALQEFLVESHYGILVLGWGCLRGRVGVKLVEAPAASL